MASSLLYFTVPEDKVDVVIVSNGTPLYVRGSLLLAGVRCRDRILVSVL